MPKKLNTNVIAFKKEDNQCISIIRYYKHPFDILSSQNIPEQDIKNIIVFFMDDKVIWKHRVIDPLGWK